MGKGKLISHPPGRQLPPGHPFAGTVILFVPRRAQPHGSSLSSGSEHHTDRLFEEPSLAVQRGGAATEMEANGADADAAWRAFFERCSGSSNEAAAQPAIAKRVPDLEDLAFEILRQARYRRGEVLGRRNRK